MRFSILIIFFSFVFLSIFRYEVEAFTCQDVNFWETDATNNSPFDFFNHPIRPSGSPNIKLDFATIVQTVFPNGDPREYGYIPHPECYAGITCPEDAGYDYSQPFPRTHPAWTNPECTCSHAPQPGCNQVTTYRSNYTSLTSGGSGTALPPYPAPIVPDQWYENYIYGHSYDTFVDDSVIVVDIKSKVDGSYPQGPILDVTKCEEDVIDFAGEQFTKKAFLLKGLLSHRQSGDFVDEGVDFLENWGICGDIHQYWTQSPELDWFVDIADNGVPIFVYVPLEDSEVEYEYTDREQCEAGFFYNTFSSKCTHSLAVPPGGCPSGYSFIPGAFGAPGSCRIVLDPVPQPCPSPSEINPSNALQCRTIITTDVPDVDGNPDDGGDPGDGGTGGCIGDECSEGNPGGGGSGTATEGRPSWCSALGDQWNNDTGVCTYGVAPADNCLAGYVWDSGDRRCVLIDGGDSGAVTCSGGLIWSPVLNKCIQPIDGGGTTDLPSGESNVVSFGDAPFAGDNTGNRNILSSGFYDPTYNPDTTISSFVESEISKWGAGTLKARLMTFVPTSTIQGKLPKSCFQLSGSTEEFCLDLDMYSDSLELIGTMLLLFSGFMAFRIVLGA
jgi:hypothetical protein